MLDPDLRPIDKLIYAEIAGFVQCRVSNEWLAERVGVSKRSVQMAFPVLLSKGYITIISWNGRNRCMAATQNMHPPVQELRDSYANSAPIDKSIDKNIDKPANAGAATEKELLENLNEVTGRTFRTLPNSAKKTLKHFTVAEIRQALDALAADPWHVAKLKELSTDYLLRITTIEKFFVDGVNGVTSLDQQFEGKTGTKSAALDKLKDLS